MEKSKTSHSTRPKVLKHGLPTLLECLSRDQSKNSPALRDVVLVSIDFEGLPAIKSQFEGKEDCQVGLAILDTRKIHRCRVPRDKLISTLQFATGISTLQLATGSSSYVEKASRRFPFGLTVPIRANMSSVARAIRALTPYRNVVLVGYGISYDLRCLRRLGLAYERRLPSAILDTHMVAREVFGFWDGSLRDLLLSLGERVFDNVSWNQVFL